MAGQQHVGAFKVPNVPLHDAELSEMAVSISKLESWLGTDLFHSLEKNIKDATESSLTSSFFTAEYRKKKMIRDIDTLDDLNRIWDGLTPQLQEILRNDYEKKKSRLENKVTT